MNRITTENPTIVMLLMKALEKVNTQAIFDQDPYESRRKKMPGSRLLKVMVFFHLIKESSQRAIDKATRDSLDAREALGGEIIQHTTLSNALIVRDVKQVIEAWMLCLTQFAPFLQEKYGAAFSRISVVDASLVRLSLNAYDWAEYRKKTGAAKITCAFDWVRGVPDQLVFKASGKAHDLVSAMQLTWLSGWTYVFDRGYFSFRFLQQLLDAGAHFVIRLKVGVSYTIVSRAAIPEEELPDGMRKITSDWMIRLPGWETDRLFRLVSYQLTDGRLIRVLTSRLDLSAVSVALLYKERWSIETWWKWLKSTYKVKAPIGDTANAFQIQIVGAFVTDLLLRMFRNRSGYPGNLYDFVVRSREMIYSPLSRLTGDLQVAYLIITELLETSQLLAEVPA